MQIDEFNSSNDAAKVFNMGEQETFDFFFRQYYTSLCFFANSILHDEDEAKDVVQDCYVKLWNSHTITERVKTVKSFLYMAVRNKCLDFLRRKKIMKASDIHLTKAGESDFEYFDEVAFAEMIREIVGHIEELPPTMQKVFKLYYVDGKKYKQIAKELNSSPEAVRKQKTRALTIIRQKLLLLLTLF